MKVEIFSDVVCPWCAIGKRRFETALSQFDHRDEVDVQWRAFELDPSAPLAADVDIATYIAKKYNTTRDQVLTSQERLAATAALEGLEFNFSKTQRTNTFDAHRLLHYAHEVGLQDALKDRLFRAYFTEGESVGDRETLVRLGTEVGLDAEKIQEILASDRYGADVRADEREAAALGINGVPFFVIDGQFGISGAQQSDVILDTLEQAWTKSHPLIVTGASGEGICDGDNCVIPADQG